MPIHQSPGAALAAFAIVLALGVQHLDGAEQEPSALPLTPNDLLSVRAGRFYLDGRPFAEISFNKFDLLWQLYDTGVVR